MRHICFDRYINFSSMQASTSLSLHGLRGGARVDASHDADISSYTSKTQSIRVWSPKGLFCLLQAKAKVEVSPEEVFDILTEPIHQSKIFRNCVQTAEVRIE